MSLIETNLKQKIDKKGIKLKDWNIQINYGIKTGLNEAFIIDSVQKEYILSNCNSTKEVEKTAQLIRPILRGKDITQYGYNWADLWLITTHNGIQGKEPAINIEDYPALKTFLNHFIDKLCKRTDKGNTPYNLRNCAYMEDFYEPTIGWQRITQKPTFCGSSNNMLYLDSMAFISKLTDNYYYLLAILNSKIFAYWVEKNVPKYGDTGYRLSNQFVEMFPVPIPNMSIKLEINILVKKIINNGLETSCELENLIYKLYNLTEEEINYIKTFM